MRDIESTDIKRWLAGVASASKGEKNKKLMAYVYELASKPKRRRISVNLDKLSKIANEGENIIVPGKVLGAGRMNKKINISAVRYSKDAIEKLKQSKCNIVSIEEMAKKDGVRVII
jgi:large subunit ribosomal protein L18e